MNPDMSSPAPMPEAPKKNNSTLIIVIVVLVVLCLCCVVAAGGYYLYTNGDKLLNPSSSGALLGLLF